MSRGGSQPSIDTVLRESARRYPERVALSSDAGELCYRELDETVGRQAGELERVAGGRAALRGRTVAVIAPNAPALVVALFAIWRLGAVAVPLNARLREQELRQILVDAEPVVVLSVRSHLGYAFTELLPRLLPGLPSAHACLFVDAALGAGAETHALEATQEPEPLADDIGAVLYTSGTTGQPKGALVGHARELEGGSQLASILALGPEDAAALVVPLSHAFGLTCLLACLAAGARAVLVESTSSLRPLLAAAEQATVLHGSPALFSSVLEARPGGLPGVRTGFVAGSPSPPELLERLDRVGMRILNLYGLTEAGAVSSCRLDDSADVRFTTAGRPLPGHELRLVPLERADAASPGELQIRGPYLTPGYYRRPDETAAAHDEDWFRTGDLATLGDDCIRIAGRSSDVVNVAGFNVFPAEVEAALLAHPDVLAAAVVGVGDPLSGETLQAFVVPRPGATLATGTLLRFARGQIAGYKLPYAIHVLPELPLLTSGKPDRQTLRHSVSPVVGSAAV